MADQFDDKVEDTYQAHTFYHQNYHNDCSECYKERRVINAWKTVNASQVEVPVKKCDNHDISYALTGQPCPRCKRLSLRAFD